MIPKVIHYCWFGGNPLPESARQCIASWRKYMPGYEIKEWNESNFDVASIAYTREAYRLNRQLLLPALEAAGRSLDVAFIYLAKDEVAPYAVIEEKMRDILTRIAQATHD